MRLGLLLHHHQIPLLVEVWGLSLLVWPPRPKATEPLGSVPCRAWHRLLWEGGASRGHSLWVLGTQGGCIFVEDGDLAVGPWGGWASRAALPLCTNRHRGCLPLGNLLSSLMGSSEQEEGEESQDDSSPIELD